MYKIDSNKEDSLDFRPIKSLRKMLSRSFQNEHFLWLEVFARMQLQDAQLDEYKKLWDSVQEKERANFAEAAKGPQVKPKQKQTNLSQESLGTPLLSDYSGQDESETTEAKNRSDSVDLELTAPSDVHMEINNPPAVSFDGNISDDEQWQKEIDNFKASPAYTQYAFPEDPGLINRLRGALHYIDAYKYPGINLSPSIATTKQDYDYFMGGAADEMRKQMFLLIVYGLRDWRSEEFEEGIIYRGPAVQAAYEYVKLRIALEYFIFRPIFYAEKFFSKMSKQGSLEISDYCPTLISAICDFVSFVFALSGSLILRAVFWAGIGETMLRFQVRNNRHKPGNNLKTSWRETVGMRGAIDMLMALAAWGVAIYTAHSLVNVENPSYFGVIAATALVFQPLWGVALNPVRNPFRDRYGSQIRNGILSAAFIMWLLFSLHPDIMQFANGLEAAYKARELKPYEIQEQLAIEVFKKFGLLAYFRNSIVTYLATAVAVVVATLPLVIKNSWTQVIFKLAAVAIVGVVLAEVMPSFAGIKVTVMITAYLGTFLGALALAGFESTSGKTRAMSVAMLMGLAASWLISYDRILSIDPVRDFFAVASEFDDASGHNARVTALQWIIKIATTGGLYAASTVFVERVDSDELRQPCNWKNTLSWLAFRAPLWLALFANVAAWFFVGVGESIALAAGIGLVTWLVCGHLALTENDLVDEEQRSHHNFLVVCAKKEDSSYEGRSYMMNSLLGVLSILLCAGAIPALVIRELAVRTGWEMSALNDGISSGDAKATAQLAGQSQFTLLSLLREDRNGLFVFFIVLAVCSASVAAQHCLRHHLPNKADMDEQVKQAIQVMPKNRNVEANLAPGVHFFTTSVRHNNNLQRRGDPVTSVSSTDEHLESSFSTLGQNSNVALFGRNSLS